MRLYKEWWPWPSAKLLIDVKAKARTSSIEYSFVMKTPDYDKCGLSIFDILR